MPLELHRSSESQRSYLGMETISSDHEVEAALLAIGKGDVHAFLILAEACYLVGKKDFARPRKTAHQRTPASWARS